MFAPTLSYRLFDPMPLPKVFRIHRKIKKLNKGLKIAMRAIGFARTIKRIPSNK
jgi:hypothetical protein